MFKGLLKKIIPSFLINRYHFLLVFLGAIFYGFPSKKLKIIGVTGTNGKSTVVELTTKILEEAGFKVASLSSIKFKIREKEWPNTLKMTMPGRFQLQKFLRQAVNSGCKYAVLEVTSEGIKQYRHKFIDFKIAIFTNLTPEHIEAHGSFENYREAKGKLFQATKGLHIINIDDENAKYFLQFPAKEKYGYGFKIPNSQFPLIAEQLQGAKRPIRISNQILNSKFQTFIAKNPQVLEKGISFSIDNKEFNLNLLGGFNIYNALAAICVGISQRIDLETCKKALEKIKGIPGRMEMVISEPFKVFVDYAFTPNALGKVYQTLKPKNFRMICVLGACGGGRDKWKRPVLGEIAGKYCDEVIVTNEDPYDEDPNQILSQIKSGISKSQFPTANFYEILDRREAIKKALSLAKLNDIVVITGKGCEPWICIAKGKKIPWDDREVVKEEFNKMRS